METDTVEMLSVSVVIPTFNREQSTHEAIDSVLSQSHRPIEIIVVDDASDVPFEPRPNMKGGIPITVLRHTKNMGAAQARQTGIEKARARYLAFLDSDDLWLPHKLETQMSLLASSASGQPLAVSCGWQSRKADGSATDRIPIASDDISDFASGCWFCPGSTVVIARRAFMDVGRLDPALRRLEDLDWFLRFALKGGRLVVANTVAAVVNTGARGRLNTVDAASDIIMSRFALMPELSNVQRCKLRAYLELERAAAARNEGRWFRMATAMITSLVLSPRLQAPLRQWWQRPT